MAEGPAVNNDDQLVDSMFNDIATRFGQIKLSYEMVECVNHCYGHCESNGLERTPTRHYLRSLLRDAQNKRLEKREKSLITINKIMSSKKHPQSIEDLINYGLLPILVKCLADHKNPSVQFAVIQTLNHICCEAPVRIQDIISANVLPELMMLLRTCSHPGLTDQIIWVLGNIISSSAQHRDEVLGLNFLSKLVNFVDKTIPIAFIRRVSWVITNIGPLSKTKPPVAPEVLVELLPTLNKLIQVADVKIIVEAIGTLDRIICLHQGNSKINQDVIDADLLKNLKLLLSHEKVQVVRSFAVCVLGNFFISGNGEHKQAFIDTGALLHFRDLLCQSNDDRLINETLDFLSIIVEYQVQAIRDTDLVPTIIGHLTKGPLETKFRALKIIFLVTAGCDKGQLHCLVNAGIVEGLCALLTCQVPRAIKMVLECLSTTFKRSMPDIEVLTDIVEECGGLEIIEKLQDDENEDVYRLSFQLIKNYFSEESS